MLTHVISMSLESSLFFSIRLAQLGPLSTFKGVGSFAIKPPRYSPLPPLLSVCGGPLP